MERERESIAAPTVQHQEPPNPSTVFMVHGQDVDAVDTLTVLLREVGLDPKGFAEARRLTKHPMPYIGDVLDAAFQHAQAVLVVFTPDERVELSARLRQAGQQITVEHQPRPNVLIEAGIALTTHPDRTIIVEMGTIRGISDLAGRHVVRWREDSPETRSELLDRLWAAGCQLKREGARWMTAGKKDAPTWA